MMTKHYFIGALGIIAFVWAATVLGQEPTPSLEQLRNMSREERIKAHQRRIEQIIQENKRRQEEEARKSAEARQQQQQPQQPTTPGAAFAGPGGPPTGIRGPVQPYTPAQQVGSPPQQALAAPTPSAARSEARSILYLRPFDSIVRPGDTFVTDIVANTKDATADELTICLSFPPAALNLLAIDFAPIAQDLREEVEYSLDSDRGLLAIRVALRQPLPFKDRPVATCYWEALKLADPAPLRFEFSEDCATDVKLGTISILGTSTNPGSGVIHGNVVIRPKSQKTAVAKAESGGAIVTTSQVDWPEGQIRLVLDPSTLSVEEEEEFSVDLALDNPEGVPFDKIQVFLRFDPELLEVVDSDRANWIRSGINIEDGFAHKRFPFDFHKANRVDNRRGIVVYEEGCELHPLRTQGVFARIHFRAKARGRTTISVLRNQDGKLPTTDVSYLTRSVLDSGALEKGIVARSQVTIGKTLVRGEVVSEAPSSGRQP